MSFQAPFSITDMRRLDMAEAQQEDQRQQAMMEGINQGIGTLLGAFMENENMKSGVKSGEKLLEVMGPAIGMTSDKLKQFDYGKMGLRDKFMFHQGWLNNVGTLAQSYNFGVGNQTRQNQQALTADLPNLRNRADAANRVAGGEGTVMLPPAPQDTFAPTSSPGPDALSASGSWYNQSNQPSVNISGGAMRPFYRSGR